MAALDKKGTTYTVCLGLTEQATWCGCTRVVFGDGSITFLTALELQVWSTLPHFVIEEALVEKA